jgi:hypothetical protein
VSDARARARAHFARGDRLRQGLELGGIVGAVVLAVVVNVLSARHFRRWDWTADRRWSLSAATTETLAALKNPVDVWAIAGPADPEEPSLRQLLVAYRAGSPQIAVHWVDPDRDAAELMDLQRRFDLGAGRTEDGRVATDAIVVVASGDRHWFLTASDMFEASDDDKRARPREERALTQAIRSVLGGEPPKLCFTTGHGELTLEPGKDEREWLGALRDLLQKSNYALSTVDTRGEDAHEPFASCDVVVLAGPRTAMAPEEANRLRAWLFDGGSLFAAVGPIEADTKTGLGPTGLDAVLDPFGIALDDDLVADGAPATAIAGTQGEGFFVAASPHPVTAGLLPDGSHEGASPARAAIFFTRSMHAAPSANGAKPAPLLSTGAGAYAKVDLHGAETWGDAPPHAAEDRTGPFIVAMASERPCTGPRAPRVVVMGSRFALAEDNWRQPRAMHGTAFFVDNALAWLAARPAVVDIPDRAEVPAGMRVSEQGRIEVRNYVLVLMPLAAALVGIAVWAYRRSNEGKPYVPPRLPGAAP